MYKLIIKDDIFTIPKENIRMLAYVKARDCKLYKHFASDDEAIKFLNSLGIEVRNLSEAENES